MWPMSRTMMWRSLARIARLVTNQINERIEPMPWITTSGGKSEAAIVGARYQYPRRG
jgi:hypothetical protein